MQLTAEKFGLIKRPRFHDLRHSHAAWLIAAKVPLPAIQARLGHESITTTVDRYGHLLDALDDEVMAAAEWAMDPTAPLPGFLLHSGLADATKGLPAVPHQRTGQGQDLWRDGNDMAQPGTVFGVEPVFVVTLGGRELPFADRDHAQQVADQWNDDRAEEMDAMHADRWPKNKVTRHGAVGPGERERWDGGGGVRTRVPDRQFVHYAMAAYESDGNSSYEPLPLAGRWTWEFEGDSVTKAVAEPRTEYRPNGTTEAHARGLDKGAVMTAFDKARATALQVCSRNPYLRPLDSTV
ncbi:tyrosine-type recombinase/integrase [Streptomyces sp. NPDC046727]|uniref:tyrosine-type recombinase/integrase n=1 Tax=Streptomyces sp. NPDC046727 TaxID=3155373 RepID=UPI0033E6BD85